MRPSVLCPPATVPESEQARRVNIAGMVLQMDIDAELDWMSAVNSAIEGIICVWMTKRKAKRLRAKL